MGYTRHGLIEGFHHLVIVLERAGIGGFLVRQQPAATRKHLQAAPARSSKQSSESHLLWASSLFMAVPPLSPEAWNPQVRLSSAKRKNHGKGRFFLSVPAFPA
jgi:hypothetical protein